MVNGLPLWLAAAVGVTYYLGNRLARRHKRSATKFTSLAAGVSITYILLELFPLFTKQALGISKLLFISVLVGFIAHHLIEKEIYQHNRRHELVKKLGRAEETFSFIYHFILGFVLVDFTAQGLRDGLLFFFPVMLFVFISTLPTVPHFSRAKTVFLSSATLLGALVAFFLWKEPPLWIETSLIGLVVGVLLFTIIRHHIPFGRAGKIGYFTIGFLLYSLVIVASWYI